MKKILAMLLAMLLAAGMLAGTAGAETVVNRDGDPIRLDVYSQLANYAGIQQG